MQSGYEGKLNPEDKLGRPRNKPTLCFTLFISSMYFCYSVISSTSVQKAYDEGKARKMTCNDNVSFLCVSCMHRYKTCLYSY